MTSDRFGCWWHRIPDLEVGGEQSDHKHWYLMQDDQSRCNCYPRHSPVPRKQASSSDGRRKDRQWDHQGYEGDRYQLSWTVIQRMVSPSACTEEDVHVALEQRTVGSEYEANVSTNSLLWYSKTHRGTMSETTVLVTVYVREIGALIQPNRGTIQLTGLDASSSKSSDTSRRYEKLHGRSARAKDVAES